MRRLTLAAVPLFAAAALGGCGVGAGDAPEGVQLRVSDGFGSRTIVDRQDPKVEGEDTVMRLLQRNADVKSGSGGGFVESIDGLAGGEDRDGNAQDWLYFRNGVQADRGAAAVRLADGDRIWWDRENWRVARVMAVTGSFPAPFLHGTDGRRQPVEVVCATPSGTACRTTVARLGAAGVTARSVAWRTTAKPTAIRLLVGPWATVRRDPLARRIASGPKVSGVFAVPSADGIRPLDRQGAAGPSVRRDWGLIAATRRSNEPPTWVVTGATEADAARAATVLRPSTLAGRFAVLLRGDRPSGLPETR